MQETPQAARLAPLLAHDAWLRRLAVQLVHDRATADDVVQETWQATLKAPPDPDRPPRPWLAQVARNFARMLARSRSRAQARLRDPALEGAAAPGAKALLERIEAQKLAVELVAALEEPYRAVILLRFYDGKTPGEIAEALRIPPGTARWRLKEGLDRLRCRLDERCGTTEKRRAFLLLLSKPTTVGAVAMLKGVMVMSTTSGASFRQAQGRRRHRGELPLHFRAEETQRALTARCPAPTIG